MAIASLALALWLLDRLYPLALPDADQSFARVVTDLEGRPLRVFADANGIWRYPVTPDAVSPLYLQALLGYEDRWFYYHPGVNPLALLRALVQNLRSGRVVSGGSTLTMQVARLLHPQPRTLTGKFRQILRALQLEWHLSKAEILTLYLNHAPFGGPVEGVAAASHGWLRRAPDRLGHADAALLAVLPQAPSRLRPDRHPERAEAARNKVLKRLQDQKTWLASAVADARQERVGGYRLEWPMRAPLLARRLVREDRDARILPSTIDGDLQARARSVVKAALRRLPPRVSVAVLIVDNASAEVRAYLGSAEFLSVERQGQVDMVRAPRSPGSALKPFLYALALDEGLIHSESLLADVPRFGSDYRPANFTRGFAGPVGASEALRRSLNVPAVDLLEQYGPHRFVVALQNAGIDLRLPAGAGPNLAVILGGAAVSLESLVSGYVALARGGRITALRLRRDRPPAPDRHLVSPGAAWIVGEMLRQAPEPGRVDPAITRGHPSIAWKTGTSYGHRDSWAVGFDRRWTVGVWIGRADGTPLPGQWGRKTAAPLMFQLFRLLPEGGAPPRPASVTRVAICWPLGTAASAQPESHCRQRRRAWVLDGRIPPTLKRNDAPYRPNPWPYWVDRATGMRVDRRCPMEAEPRSIALWPEILEAWLPWTERAQARLPAPYPGCPPPVPVEAGRLRIVGLDDGAVLYAARPDALPVVNLKVTGGVGRLRWYVDGVLVHDGPAGAAVNHRFVAPGRRQIVVVDSSGRTDRIEVEVRLR